MKEKRGYMAEPLDEFGGDVISRLTVDWLMDKLTLEEQD